MSHPSSPASDRQYPVGRFHPPAGISEDDRLAAIATLADLPGNLRNATDGLSPDQLDTPYRDGGWSVRQLVHHLADSHSQASARIRFALTEDWPTIKPYDQDAWAHLRDARAPVEWSLELLEALHARLVMLLQSLSPAEWQRGYLHPENGPTTIEQAALLYAWHSRHHTAHITHLRAREDW